MKALRFALLAVSLLLIPIATGACGFKDIDKRFFVVSMGIDPADKGAKGFKITLRLAVPSPKNEPGSSMSKIVSIQAESIAEGVRLLKAHVDKELDFGHCKLFLLGKGIVEKDYKPTLNWLSRRRDVQSIAFMAVGQPDAQSILQIEPTTERYPGNTLFLMFGNDATQSSYLSSVFLFDFIRRFEEKGINPVLPVIRGEKNGYAITQLGLFDDTKLLVTLNPGETETFNQIKNQNRKSTVSMKMNGIPLVINVDHIDSHFKLSKVNNEYVLKQTLKVSGLFEEAPLGIYNEDWKKLEALFNKQISGEIEKLLKKFQQAGVDPMGFGLRYRATHAGSPQTYKDWLKIYPNLKFDVKVQTKIDGVGLVK
ncbi:Ger(x)C family spore germination protein [Paenibacillus rhizovicinus]|uniref:Ger(X)C family spore germination protein n=1 Tax=Paenibacillus rhizovicinus TaxID=2704463 RepID=A0A6C0NY16_9BACL|nr:Ger(x)C family spore germination protein [Paenibacillus rhizovicinus]QHW30613.1 Ger(x)C family spore germination protein [Paenibacillus rhizovicinus]